MVTSRDVVISARSRRPPSAAVEPALQTVDGWIYVGAERQMGGLVRGTGVGRVVVVTVRCGERQYA